MKSLILQIYDKCLEEFGYQNWWPADTHFEVVIGAILTQNTSWNNVERALNNLKDNNLLNPQGLYDLEREKLENLIFPAGFYKQKTEYIKCFLSFLKKYDFSLEKLFSYDVKELRNKLLSVKGIGKETADSIILYAADKKIFVVDNYTKRILSRVSGKEFKDYEEIRELFENSIPSDLEYYKDFHAQLVMLGKNFCKKKPICKECPLRDVCESKNS